MALLPGVPAPARAADDAYLAELKAKALSLALHEERTWNVLLHYRSGILGFRSLVDDPLFFLAPEGKTDAKAELMATLDGLFDGTSVPPPFCRFPGRYAFLAERLGFDPARVPHPPCPEVDNIVRTIGGQSATLVFASGYVNAPASMFGHTFLRIDSEYESPLLAFAVNYAAKVEEGEGAIKFTLKGLMGGYRGYYSVLPYYEKVREYANIDQRDMWEYRLNLTPDEVRRLVLHLLDLKGIATDYFFFDENCSYELLFLIDAARPEARLTETGEGYWVIPMDTVRASISAGLVDNVTWRPSRARLIRHTLSFMTDREAELSRGIVDGTLPPDAVLPEPLPDAGKVRVLDLAALITQYRIAKKDLGHETFQKRFHGILGARTRLAGAEAETPPPPVPPPPDAGHRSARGSLGAGFRGDDPFLEAGLRPAYHDLTDDPAGYTEGSRIEFFSGAVRWYPEDDRIRLSRLDLVRIESLDPADRIFRPKSWKVRAGLETRDFGEGTDGLVSFGGAGVGLSLRIGEGTFASLLAEVEGAISRRYHASYRLAPGASANLITEPVPGWRARFEARGMWGAVGDTKGGPDLSANLRQNVRLGRDLSLSLDLTHGVQKRVRRTEGVLAIHRYF